MSQQSTTETLRGLLPAFSLSRAIIYFLIFFFTVFFLVPLWTGFMTSLKTDHAVTFTLPFLPPVSGGFTLNNWATAFDMLLKGLVNSFVMTVPATLLCVIFGSAAAYGLTLLDWRAQLPVFLLFVIGIFIPYQAVLVPLSRFWVMYAPLQDLLSPLYGLPFVQPAHSQLVALIITHVGYGIPIATLLFRGYYLTLPDDLVEAARIDGASITKIYQRIVLPLSKPMVGVVFIYQFTMIWNEFLFALTIIGSAGSPVSPVTLILAGLGTSISGTDYGIRMAGAFIAALPTLIVFVLFTEQFAEGLEAGGG